ncbi:hypothetical protein A6R68_05546, partial [Neotoma lepida]
MTLMENRTEVTQFILMGLTNDPGLQLPLFITFLLIYTITLRLYNIMENWTEVTHFLLLGLTDDPSLQLPLFITFLLIYTITLVGNLGMIILILMDPRLHTPMYFFLGDKVISYNDCAAQMFFFAAFITVENYLLASMAYDRYAA